MKKLKVVQEEEFLSLLEDKQCFQEYYFQGKITVSAFPYDVIFERCVFDDLDFACAQIDVAVTFKSCHFETSAGGFFASYFIKGLVFIDCIFVDIFNFGCGGHNEPPYEFRLENCIFHEFASFSDCWFIGPVIVVNNQFLKGTDLLGDDGKPYATQFDTPPVIVGNVGQLDVSYDEWLKRAKLGFSSRI